MNHRGRRGAFVHYPGSGAFLAVGLAADQLRPLRGPLELGGAPPAPPVALLIAVALLALVGALLIIVWVRGRQPLGPGAVAERELVRLLGLRLVEQGRLKEHYALLAACLRRYVADVYGLPAPALTPSELAAALEERAMDAGFVGYLRRVLGTGDLVHFDHTGKTAAEARADVLGAIEVIRAASSLPSASAV